MVFNDLPDNIPKREIEDIAHRTKQALIALNGINGMNATVYDNTGIFYDQLYGPGKALRAAHKLRLRIQNHAAQRFFACRNFRHRK